MMIGIFEAEILHIKEHLIYDGNKAEACPAHGRTRK